MRCPHCAGEIPDASRYCGICGRGIGDEGAAAPRGSGAPDASSMSLFELPESRRGRATRVALVLLLDLMLAGAGVAMITTYLQSRVSAGESVGGEPDAGGPGKVTVLPPEPAPPEPAAPAPGQPTSDGAEPTGTDRGARPTPRRSRPAPPAAKPPSRAPRPATGGATPPKPEPEPAPPPPAGSPSSPPTAETPDAPEAGLDAGTGLSEEEVADLAGRIGAIVGGHQRQIERCYAQASKVFTPDDPLKGRIDLRFTVMPDGKASDVRVARNGTGSDVLGSCLVGLLKTWQLPSARAPADFIWPFKFTPPKQ